MDLHGGRISVRSEGEGLGCTFTVDLPVYLQRGPSARNMRIYHSRSVQSQSSNREYSDYREESETEMPRVGSTSHPNLSADGMGRGLPVRQDNTRSVVRPFVTPLASPAVSCRHSYPAHHSQLIQAADTEDGARGNSKNHEVQPTPLVAPVDALSDARAHDTRNGYTSSSADIQIRVLVVDDAGLNRKMMCRLLKGRCQTTGEAFDGLDAVTKVQIAEEENRPYNVILMDFQMPILDGPGAARQLRSNGYVGLIVGITGMSAGTDMEEFRAAGADCVLTKPVSVEDLDPIFQGSPKRSCALFHQSSLCIDIP